MDRTPEPTNDHERTIAAAIDSKLLASDSPYESVVTEIVMSVPFDMSIAETEFLFVYAHWRLAHSLKNNPHAALAGRPETRWLAHHGLDFGETFFNAPALFQRIAGNGG
jgi:hypothetical protein